ncbi:hypothetical protein GNT65_20205 [Shewanella sp. JBTF-M18]|uniref:Uncharacterized protein n=1 Tax=Shewanella insulae TaxID=2681496 RepID=A0A6L7I542_9GAMM|nr:hypothetical protein [Shewanella insulae]MXR70984.1 hypothetical protein [Shewanella insulae]
MMKADVIPTVRSLLAQNAISVSGDKTLITRLSSVLSFKEYYVKPDFTCDIATKNWSHELNALLSLTDSINRPITKQVLYSIELLPERFTLTAHIHNATGCDHKTIYTKRTPNLKQLGHTFNALYRRLDESQQFVICRHCRRLVAAELCNDDACCCAETNARANKQNAHQPCLATFKQTFDTDLVDRISRTGDAVSVFKDEDQIKFYVRSTAWPLPYECYTYDRVIDTLPLSATPDEVNALRLKLEREQKYPTPCYHCEAVCDEGEAMGLASFVDFETDALVCYGCASKHYGVVY